MTEPAKEELELGSKECLSAHQNYLYSSKHKETPVLSYPRQPKLPKLKPASTGVLGGTHRP